MTKPVELVLRWGLLLLTAFCNRELLAAPMIIRLPAIDEAASQQVQEAASGQVRSGEDFQEVWTDRRLIQESVELSSSVRKLDVPAIREQLWILREAQPFLLVPSEENELWIPLYRFLFREIRKLPEQIRAQVWVEEEPRANSELADAIRSGKPQSLISVIQHYPGSQASCRAFLILARQQLEKGHLLAALAWLEPLRSGGVEDIWSEMAGRTAAEIESRLVAHNDSADEATGDVPKTAPVHPSSNQAWNAGLPVSRSVVTKVQELRNAAKAARVVLWSNWEPVLDKDRIFVRTLRGLLAFNRSDGTVDWLFAGAANYENWLSGSNRNLPSGDILQAELPGALFSTMEWTRTADLLHRNSVVGQMTQDAERLYLIDDTLEIDNAPQSTFNIRAPSIAPDRMPRLTALRKNDGQREWTVGGPVMERQYFNSLAGAWFAGPPTATPGKLFSVLELGGSIQMLQLDPETGRVIRSVVLGFPQVSIQTDRARRLKMARPVCSDGLIWTETTTGWLCAIDESSYSLLWVRKIGRRPDEQNIGLPNQPVLMTRTESIAAAWKAVPPMLFRRNLCLFVSENRELKCVDCVNGAIQFSRNDLNSFVALPTHLKHILLIGPDGVSAVSSEDGSLFWRTASPGDRIPAGTGVMESGRLLVPFSDGTVFAFSITDGTATELQEHRNAAGESCQLFGDTNQLFQYVPWKIQSVIPAGGPESRTSPAELARRFLHERRPVEAWELLAPLLDPLIPESAELSDLRLQSLYMLFKADPASTAELLKQHLKHPISRREKATCLTLQMAILQQANDQESEDSFLLELLNQPEELLQQDVGPYVWLQGHPDPPSEYRSPAYHQSLRQWTLRKLESRIAADETETSAFLERVLRLEDHHLLSIRSCLIADELHRRATAEMTANMVNEKSLQLLTHDHSLTELPQENSRYRQSLIELHQQLMEANPEDGTLADPAQREVIESLLESMLLDHELERRRDLKQESEGDVSEPSGIWRARTQHESEEWLGWKDQPYRIIPISQSVSFRQSEQRLIPRSQSDTFMSRFDWGLIRVPSALKAVARVNGRPLNWTVPGTFPTAPPTFLGNISEIERYNSVVLIQTHLTVTGVSVADRRVLWMRKIPDGAQGTLAAGFYQRPPFRDPVSATRVPPGMTRRLSVYQLLPAGPRLAVMQTDQQLSVFDTYTGEDLWSLNDSFEHDLLFVCRNTLILFNPQTAEIRAVRIYDGAPTETRLTADQLSRVLGNGESHLVMWNKGPSSQPDELQWVDPETADIIHQIRLPEQATLQYLDTDTLAAVSGKELAVISFKFQTRRNYLSEDGWFADAESPTDESILGDLLHVMADRYHFYVIQPTATERDQITSLITGRVPKVMSGKLTAIRRSDGRKLWTISTGRATASFEHGGSPVMLLLEHVRPENGAAAAPIMNMNSNQMIIRGILKTTGTTLFEHRQSSRYPIPIVEIRTGIDFSVDIEAFGSRARFVPVASVQILPSFPEN